MIIYRQKIFFSEEFYKKWEKKSKRAGRAALFKTATDAALGGVKNAGIQALDAAKHPLQTSKAVFQGVGGKIKNSWQSLGNTFGIGKGSEDLTTSKRVRNIIHFASPTARRAMNIHDTASHVLGKDGKSWVDSMARFKTTPISYIGQKTDTVARVGLLAGASNLSGKMGLDKVASGFGKAQNVAGGQWLDVSKVLPGKNPAVQLAGKITGYTTGERPGGLFEEIGKAATKGKEAELAKQMEAFKSTKQARRAANYLDKNRVVKAANKVAKADEKVVGAISQGINTVGEKVNRGLGTIGQNAKSGVSRARTRAQTVLSGLGSAFKRKPTFVPIPARI